MPGQIFFFAPRNSFNRLDQLAISFSQQQQVQHDASCATEKPRNGSLPIIWLLFRFRQQCREQARSLEQQPDMLSVVVVEPTSEVSSELDTELVPATMPADADLDVVLDDSLEAAAAEPTSDVFSELDMELIPAAIPANADLDAVLDDALEAKVAALCFYEEFADATNSEETFYHSVHSDDSLEPEIADLSPYDGFADAGYSEASPNNSVDIYYDSESEGESYVSNNPSLDYSIYAGSVDELTAEEALDSSAVDGQYVATDPSWPDEASGVCEKSEPGVAATETTDNSGSDDVDLTTLDIFLDTLHEELEELEESIEMVKRSPAISEDERDFALTTLKQQGLKLSMQRVAAMVKSPVAFARTMGKRARMEAVADVLYSEKLMRSALEAWRIQLIIRQVKIENADAYYQGDLVYWCFSHLRTLAQARLNKRQEETN
ncbi:hypothetical protein H4R20_002015 [Coemansia guatemalensis]|uniref:Uncharacterized protein n=1 Tax=Coemansia guatemalensis TaxID=2761395 RepID=A0A9W8LSQ2_9FUNG|nr:hypothetical protein H4R20_002015 [Coemansia guatemalensis]